MNWPTAAIIVSGFIVGALVLSQPAVSQSPGTWTGVGMEGNSGWVVNVHGTGQGLSDVGGWAHVQAEPVALVHFRTRRSPGSSEDSTCL